MNLEAMAQNPLLAKTVSLIQGQKEGKRVDGLFSASNSSHSVMKQHWWVKHLMYSPRLLGSEHKT